MLADPAGQSTLTTAKEPAYKYPMENVLYVISKHNLEAEQESQTWARTKFKLLNFAGCILTALTASPEHAGWYAGLEERAKNQDME
jgi:hypothetical protein